MSEPVLWHVQPSETGRQLVMFPFLGGFGASYSRLVRELTGDWDIWTVNPPGHGPSTQPPCTRLSGLVDCCLEGLDQVLKPGAVFFGHSMGGVVAYNVLTAMEGHPGLDERRPLDLVLSATCAPRQLPVAGYARLPEPMLLQHLMTFGAMPAEVVSDRSLVELFLPAFRADYQVLEDAQRRPAERLDIRTRLILGGQDPQTPKDTPAAWQEYLTKPIRTHVLEPEEHMFVLHAMESLDLILNDVRTAPHLDMLPTAAGPTR